VGGSCASAFCPLIDTNPPPPTLPGGPAGPPPAAGPPPLDPAGIARAAQNPAGLHALPDRVAEPIVQAYADTLHTVFLWTVPVAAVGFVVALFLKQVTLRDSARAAAPDMGEGFSSPAATGDSEKLLELSVGRILRRTDYETARSIVAASDTRLDTAGAWAVMQVELFTRTVGHASLGLISAGRRVPPEVLLPVFDRMVDEGYLTRDGNLLSHTAAGRREADVITHAWGDWLSDLVASERGRPSGPELRVATDAIAKRIVAEDLASGLPRGRTTAGAGAR
ncbi:MFS transporter, partial [Streptomyces sp. NPDC059082]